MMKAQGTAGHMVVRRCQGNRLGPWLGSFALFAITLLASGCGPVDAASPASPAATSSDASAGASTPTASGLNRATKYFQIGISGSIEKLDGTETVLVADVMDRASYPAFRAAAVEFLDKKVAAAGGCAQPTYISFNTNWEASYAAFYVCSEAEAVTVYNTVAPANRDATMANPKTSGSMWDTPDGWWAIDGKYVCPTKITGLDQLPESPSSKYEVDWGGTSYCLTMLYATRAEPSSKPPAGQEKMYLADKYRKMLRDLVQETSVKPSEWDQVRALLT